MNAVNACRKLGDCGECCEKNISPHFFLQNSHRICFPTFTQSHLNALEKSKKYVTVGAVEEEVEVMK